MVHVIHDPPYSGTIASLLVSFLTRLRRDAKSLANVRWLAEGHKCAHKKRVYDLLRIVRWCAPHCILVIASVLTKPCKYSKMTLS